MKVAVLPVYCSDSPRTTTYDRAHIVATFDVVVGYYVAQSGGREHLQYQVFDWFQLALTSQQWNDAGFNVGDSVVATFNSRQLGDLSGFEHFVLLIDKPDARAAAWDPIKHYLHLSAIDFSPALLAHEMGHLAGTGHGFLKTPFVEIAYGDDFCIMGGESNKFTFPAPLGNTGPNMAASMLHICGWLDYEHTASGINLALGNTSTSGPTVTLGALDGAPPAGAATAPVVAWSDGLVPGKRLLLEYRARTDWDRNLPTSANCPGWIVAHLTAANGTAKDSVLIGSIGANRGAVLELPDASVTVTVTDAQTNAVTLAIGRRIRHVFFGGNAVIYTIDDTGNLYWFKHDGWNDGSFRWTDVNPRLVATGWIFKQVFAGDDGVIYAINDDDALLWFRHEGHDDGSARWTDPNPRIVGSGWSSTRIFSGGNGVLYVIDPSDALLWYRHDGRKDGSFRWAAGSGNRVGTGWGARKVFAGSGGVIYVIDYAGNLLWFLHQGRDDGSFRWLDAQGRKVGVGWTNEIIFCGQDGVIYTIDDAGNLLWFRHDGVADGTFRWTDPGPRKVGVGWNVKNRVDSGEGIIYAVDASNQLLWYRHDGRQNGDFKWRFDNARVSGQGWNAKHLFAADDSVIYSINDAGDLRWYRHDGRVNGSFNWTLAIALPDDTPTKCGTGWNMDHVFAAEEGVIYAVTPTGDLLWFQHTGRKNGSFNWTDPNPRKVGTGWHVKQIFSGGDGVIYAIDAGDNLLWYRHTGWRDGTFRWADPGARTVGTGWQVKQIFSGGDGIIYYVDASNRLIWNNHLGRNDGSFRWAAEQNRQVGVGWDVQRVFGA